MRPAVALTATKSKDFMPEIKAINTEYGPPMVRATIPQLTPSVSSKYIVVWKQAQGAKGSTSC